MCATDNEICISSVHPGTWTHLIWIFWCIILISMGPRRLMTLTEIFFFWTTASLKIFRISFLDLDEWSQINMTKTTGIRSRYMQISSLFYFWRPALRPMKVAPMTIEYDPPPPPKKPELSDVISRVNIDLTNQCLTMGLSHYIMCACLGG